MGYFITEKAARVVGGQGQFMHRFGGEPTHRIKNQHEYELVLHSLYLFDTSDPLLPSVIPGRHWLPLYYGMFNDGCELAYQVVTDNEIILHQVYGDLFLDLWEDREWPGDRIPPSPVKVAPVSYDEQKTLVYAYTASGSFNESAISAADKRFLDDSAYPFTQIGGIQSMLQGRPEDGCANAECDSQHLSVFAVVWNNPITGFKLWGEYGDFTQIIFQVCQACYTIHVCNRCS